jgi:periplasmic divalent cation tolerance protein
MKIVLVTAPKDRAEEIVRRLVDERLAACGTIVPGVTSVYRWKGAVERSEESQIVLKTSGALVGALTARIAALHPYEVPEIVAIEPSFVHVPYASWVEEETRETRAIDSGAKESPTAADEES